MRKINNINEQIGRMKSLFTEERMFGNLVEQEETNSETEENTNTPEETETEEEVNLDKRGCIKHIKEKFKEVNSSGDAPKWKRNNPSSVKTIESCLKTHYET